MGYPVMSQQYRVFTPCGFRYSVDFGPGIMIYGETAMKVEVDTCFGVLGPPPQRKAGTQSSTMGNHKTHAPTPLALQLGRPWRIGRQQRRVCFCTSKHLDTRAGVGLVLTKDKIETQLSVRRVKEGHFEVTRQPPFGGGGMRGWELERVFVLVRYAAADSSGRDGIIRRLIFVTNSTPAVAEY